MGSRTGVVVSKPQRQPFPIHRFSGVYGGGSGGGAFASAMGFGSHSYTFGNEVRVIVPESITGKLLGIGLFAAIGLAGGGGRALSHRRR